MSLVISFFVNFVFIATFFYSTSHAEQVSDLFLLKKRGYRLKKSIFQAISAENEIACASHCASDKLKCKSFNFNENPSVHVNCELNSNVALTANDESLVASTNTTYFEKIEEEEQGKDCAALYKKGHTTDGVYSIDPDGRGAFRVRCDMSTSGGGWTIVQRRIDGSVDFFLNWKDYKNGFGDPAGEYWLGLDKINRLTNSGKQIIRIDMGDTTGVTKYAEYNFFAIASEKVKYKLSLGTYSGTAGDSLGGHNGHAFSTRDVDNDTSGGNCAATYKGAWWYTSCHTSNLNGHYYLGKHASYADGVNWQLWKGYNYSLRKTEMKLRPFAF